MLKQSSSLRPSFRWLDKSFPDRQKQLRALIMWRWMFRLLCVSGVIAAPFVLYILRDLGGAALVTAVSLFFGALFLGGVNHSIYSTILERIKTAQAANYRALARTTEHAAREGSEFTEEIYEDDPLSVILPSARKIGYDNSLTGEQGGVAYKMGQIALYKQILLKKEYGKTVYRLKLEGFNFYLRIALPRRYDADMLISDAKSDRKAYQAWARRKGGETPEAIALMRDEEALAFGRDQRLAAKGFNQRFFLALRELEVLMKAKPSKLLFMRESALFTDDYFDPEGEQGEERAPVSEVFILMKGRHGLAGDAASLAWSAPEDFERDVGQQLALIENVMSNYR